MSGLLVVLLVDAAVVSPRVAMARPLIDLLRRGTAGPSIDAEHLYVGDFIASGQFGAVCWAQLGDLPCVAKRACEGVEHTSATAATTDELRLKARRSAEYLETEAQIHRLMNERVLGHSSVLSLHEAHIAPYLGECIKDGTRYLVWRAAGEETLDDYLKGGRERLPELARALGCDVASLPRVVLHNVLRGLAHVHACGVAHRDCKPANLLVDPKAQTLRLIDFGSAADCAGWIDLARRGLRADRVPASPLFTPTSKAARPRAYDDRAGWYKYDIYGAALVWLCVAVPELAKDYGKLYELRSALEAHGHDPDAWRTACAEEARHGQELGAAEECEVPASAGFEAVFGWHTALPRERWSRIFRHPPAARVSRRERLRAERVAHASKGGDQELAWRLLTSLLDCDSGRRPSAAEALLGRYLNADCSEAALPTAAPEPWTIEALLSASGARPSASLAVAADECAVPPGL